jgi:hypothetical protein
MPSQDELDDLLYCSRAGEFDELKAFVDNEISRQRESQGHQEAFNELMGEIAMSNEARNTLLHFAAANGHSCEYFEKRLV